MDIYKQAAFTGTRVQTTRGLLTVEQLITLPIDHLDMLAVSLEEKYEASKGKSFIKKRSVKDKEIKLQFDIVLDILNTKVEERDSKQTTRETKEHNDRIYGLIAEQERKEEGSLSIEELKKRLK